MCSGKLLPTIDQQNQDQLHSQNYRADQILCQALKDLIENSSLRDRSRLRSESQMQAGDCLQAPPNANLGSHFDKGNYLLLINRHLGLPMLRCPLRQLWQTLGPLRQPLGGLPRLWGLGNGTTEACVLPSTTSPLQRALRCRQRCQFRARHGLQTYLTPGGTAGETPLSTQL